MGGVARGGDEDLLGGFDWERVDTGSISPISVGFVLNCEPGSLSPYIDQGLPLNDFDLSDLYPGVTRPAPPTAEVETAVAVATVSAVEPASKRRKTDYKGRPHKCEMCGSRFAQKWKLNRHKEGHDGNKPHVCNKCGDCFARRDKRNEHMRIHTDARFYKCDECLSSFGDRRTLSRHKNRAHSKKLDVMDVMKE